MPLKMLIRLYKKIIRNQKSALNTSGWLESFKRGYPCDLRGDPLPWMNYAVIALLNERLNRSMQLFEFGSGYSTKFYAKRVALVTSVEYDLDWYELLNSDKPDNVSLLYQKKKISMADTVALSRDKIVIHMM